MADEIEKLFYEVDESGDGRISPRELYKMLKSFGVKLSIKSVKTIVYKYDKDGSRDIDLAEFRMLFNDILDANKIFEEAYEVFSIFDVNKDNLITREEAKNACDKLQRKLTDEEFDEFMNSLDVDGNGVVDFYEFLNAYAVGL